MRYNKDYYGGALMIVVGLGAAFGGLHYRVGTPAAMGPGFFPAALGVILTLLGIAIALSAGPAPAAGAMRFAPDRRGALCIIGGIVAFVVLGVYGGLVPATFAVVFISALGDRQNTLAQALGLALAMVAIGVAVFWWGLKIQLPLFGWG